MMLRATAIRVLDGKARDRFGEYRGWLDSETGYAQALGGWRVPIPAWEQIRRGCASHLEGILPGGSVSTDNGICRVPRYVPAYRADPDGRRRHKGGRGGALRAHGRR